MLKIITRSSYRSKEFYETGQKNFHLDVKRRLNLDMNARWNSTYKMLDNVLYYKDVFVHLGTMSSHFAHYVPSTYDWNKLLAIHKFLKLFYDETCMFSTVNTPTSNLYLRGAWMIHRCLVETARGPHVFLASMVESMLEKFDKYWLEYNLYLSCAAILDPRFKIKMVEYCLDKLFGGDEAAMRVENVLSTLKSLYNEYKSQSSASPIVAPPPSSGFDLHEFFDDYHSYTPRNTRVQIGKS